MIRRKLLAAIAAVLTVWGGIFYGLTSTDDDDPNEVDF